MVKKYIEAVVTCYDCPKYHCSNGMTRAYCNRTGDEIDDKYIFGENLEFPPFCPLEEWE